MITKRRLVFGLLWLISLSICLNKNNSFAQPGDPRQAPPASRSGEARTPVSLTLNKGMLQFSTPVAPVLSNMRARLRFADGSALAGTFEAAGQDTGADKAGAFERLRYRLKPVAWSTPDGSKNPVNAVLEVRQYAQPVVVVVSMDYEGSPLAATDGVQLITGFDGFARGMALKQMKLYWTAPVFVSDHRHLSSANQLLLWRQMRGDDFHLMIPLAGDGMISTLGVAEIDYRYEFRVAASSYDPKFAPRRIPLFAYSASADPYRLPQDTYRTVFASGGQYGRLRWEKSFPEVFGWLGWCSWNTYQHGVTEQKVIDSVRSLRDRNIPVGFVLVDDGWLKIKDNKLAGFDADPQKFPRGMAGLARTLRDEYHIPHVGVWHTFQGYWDGVDREADFVSSHKLFTGVGDKSLPDPRDGQGEGFYADWYSRLKSWGYDFVKVDGQSNVIKFTNGLMPLFTSGGGEQRNMQEAASRHFSDANAPSSNAQSPGLNIINCMEMTLENAFNWRLSNVARNSDDYLPDSPQNAKEHVYQNAYNAYWTSNFAYPDWDMFQSHDPHAEYHAAARAVSGGPIYFTDEPGKEQPDILRRLIFSDGRLLLLDAPGQVTRDLLLTNVALEAVPLKVFGHVSRPGLSVGTVAAFNVNKSAENVGGMLRATDAESAGDSAGAGTLSPEAAAVAVYQRGNGRAFLLDEKQAALPFSLGSFGFELFTLSPVRQGFAAFGLLDKYLGAAGIVSQEFKGDEVSLRLGEPGEFGAWLAHAPLRIELDGRVLPPAAYRYERGLLRVPHASFVGRTGVHELRVRLAPGQR